jgi:hypothetical protein
MVSLRGMSSKDDADRRNLHVVRVSEKAASLSAKEEIDLDK